MKTVYTTLPIYKALRDQCENRSRVNGSGSDYEPVFTPSHRLPSFQWMDNGDGATAVISIYLIDIDGLDIDITGYFVTLPAFYTSADGDEYFIYNGDTLENVLPGGKYYLKIVMDSDHIYYSEWFYVDCIYPNLAETFVNNSFDTFNIVGTVITSAIDAGAGAYAKSSPLFTVYKDQVISIIFFLTETGATNPQFSVVSDTLGLISNEETSVTGLNELTLIVTDPADDAYIKLKVSGTTNFSTTEILVLQQFSEKWVTLSFTNCCNLGNLLYEDDFVQTLWLKGENIEQEFPYVEKGQENGEGRFIPTFRRQEKTYLIRTGIVTQSMVDALQRLKLHDVITFIDQVGNAFNVETVDIEHTWQHDKYFGTVEVTIDCGEEIVAIGCCSI